ncbi:MAG: hypothetical protein ACKV0T_16395 [Planctomycetales bacterium]
MRRSVLWSVVSVLALGTVSINLSSPLRGTAQAQDKGKPAKKGSKSAASKPIANTKSLDIRAEQVQSAFVKDAEELATSYLEAGHLDKAKGLLKSLLALNPGLTHIKKKLDQIDESLMNANDLKIDVNTAHGWDQFGIQVFENKPIRFQVEGTYRLDVAGPVGAAGLPDKDAAKDVVAGIPCGALMGIIVANGKPGKPFQIGEGVDHTPKEAGILALRVNTPAGNKNVGKLKVTVSGGVKSQ